MNKIYYKMFIKAFFIQSLWNFERLQNIGFLFVMKPYLDKIYTDKNERRRAFLRHISFFNTHPYMANAIVAITSNMEKRISTGEMPPESVNQIKSSMSGSLAAIGDSFFWGTLRPFLSFICVFLIILFARVLPSDFASYSVFVPVFFLFSYNIVHIPFRYWLMFISFRLDKDSINMISKLEIKFLWEMMRYAGLIFVIFSMFFYFKVFGFAPLNANFFGTFIPDAVVYGAVLVPAIILGRFSATFMFYSIILICIIMSYLGI